MQILNHFLKCNFSRIQYHKSQVGSNLSGLSTTRNLNSEFHSFLIYHSFNFCGNFLKWRKFGSNFLKWRKFGSCFYFCPEFSGWKRNFIRLLELSTWSNHPTQRLIQQILSKFKYQFQGELWHPVLCSNNHVLLSLQFQGECYKT